MSQRSACDNARISHGRQAHQTTVGLGVASGHVSVSDSPLHAYGPTVGSSRRDTGARRIICGAQHGRVAFSAWKCGFPEGKTVILFAAVHE